MKAILRRALHTVIAWACVAASVQAAPAWVRIETPNFVVFGEVGERGTREVARSFERFREAMARILPAAAHKAAVPTIVVVFRDQKSFGRYRPRYNGRPVELGGFFYGTREQNVVALAVESHAQALRIVFHEYAHLVIMNAARTLPTWLNEGLAEYYSTFKIDPDGRSAILGAVVPEHVALLRRENLLPLEELFSIDPRSPHYNEGSRRSVFYAQSWGVVHTLVSAEPDRSQQLSQYVRAILSGAGSVEAWRQTFGDLDIHRAMRSHLSKPRVRALQARFSTELATVEAAGIQVAPEEIEAVLGDVLRLVAPPEEAEAHLQQAAARQPASPRATALLALLRAEAGKYEEARALLANAVAGPDWLASYTAAVALTQVIMGTSGEDQSGTIDRAITAFDTVLEARPELPYALAMQGLLRLERGDLDESLRAIRRARELSPGREDFAFAEVRVLVRRREFAAARAILGPFLSPLNPDPVREYARTLMTSVVQSERAASAPETSHPAGAVATLPVYRKPADGEQKIEGVLERIECSAGQVVIHVRGEDRLLRYTARSMDAIEFLTYRDDLSGTVSCAPRVPPDRVFITWRAETPPKPGFDGTVVAVEFLPRP